MAALDPRVTPQELGLFVSLRLSLAKALLTAGGLLGGLAIGREGPSVQIAAGVMHHAARWLPKRSRRSRSMACSSPAARRASRRRSTRRSRE